MLTFCCISVAIGSLWFVGLPVARLLFGPEEDKEKIWVSAPFIGLAVVILVLQNLVYLDIPLRYSTPWLLVIVCFLWGWLFKSKQIVTIFRAAPRLLLFSALSAYVIQGSGLIAAGAKYYVGRAWHDQFNYTAITQFLVDLPFSSSFNDVATSPYLFHAVFRKLDRIGQSVFHGFVSVAAFTDAKTTFEAVILLSPLLTLLAVYWLGRKLSLPFWPSLTVACASGILPALAAVHLECFFSQALCIPFLLVWPAFLSETCDRLSVRWLLASALILAVATGIYTEFYIIFIATGALMACIKAFYYRKRVFYILSSFFALMLCSLVLNLGYMSAILTIFRRISDPGVLLGLYPWAFSLEGITRIWLGDFGASLPGWWNGVLSVVSAVLLLVAYAGIGIAVIKGKDALSFIIATLMALPVVLIFKGLRYEYQFYKLLLSVSPLMPLGIALFLQAFQRIFKLHKPYGRFIIPTAVITMIGFSAYGTAEMTLRAGVGRTLEKIGRGGAHKLLMPSTMAVQEVLSNIHNKDLYISYEDEFFGGNFVNGWLTYFGRHNRVWVANPLVGDMNLSKAKLTPFLPTDDPYLLTESRIESYKDYLVWSCEPFYLHRFPLSSWAAVSKFINSPRVTAAFEGFEHNDFLTLNESIGGEGSRDAVILVVIRSSGIVNSIEIRNTNGQHSVWDTVPDNGCSLLGVAKADKPDILINRLDGSVAIDIQNPCSLIFYLADNGSISGGRTKLEVIISFADGRMARAPVGGMT